MPEHFGAQRPDFKKVTSKAKKQNEIELTVNYDHITNRTKYVDFADYQLQDPELFKKILNEVFDMHSKGVIEPYISKIFTFHDVNKALKYLQGRKCLGKVLVKINSESQN